MDALGSQQEIFNRTSATQAKGGEDFQIQLLSAQEAEKNTSSCDHAGPIQELVLPNLARHQ